MVFDKQKNAEVAWTPTNANGRFSGDSLPLKSAFAQSVNSVAVKLGQEVGIDNIVKTAHDMGIESPLDNTPSLALGSSDVKLLEMVNAYSTIANEGKAHEPVLVTRIVDRDGNEVYVAPTEQRQAIPYRSAFLVQQLLMGGVREAGGTSQSLNGYVGQYRDTDFGGKTGTSNNHSDAWFVGVTPKLVVGAWVGGEYRCIHFRTGALGQGSRTALPICGYFLQSVLGDPNFKQYRGKFPNAKDESITPNMYNCSGVYRPKAKADTTVHDSAVYEEDVTLDDEFTEGGNTEHHHNSHEGNAEMKEGGATEHEKPAATEQKKRKKPTYEEVTF